MTPLEEIAAAMVRTALEHPGEPVKKPLKGGLWLIMRFKTTDWLLSLSRAEKPPSAGEVQICRAAFRVPEFAAQESATVGQYRIVRLSWGNTQLQIFQDGDTAARAVSGNYYLE